MKFILLGAVALSAAVSAPAIAQTASDAPFTGPRVELHGGWDWQHAKARVNDGTTTLRAHDHSNAGFAGAQVGYDYAVRGSTVVGVFASYDFSNNQKCNDDLTTTNCVKTNRNIEAGARVGEVFGGKTLVYLKGAYVNGKFRAYSQNDATGAYLADHSKRDGWRAGAGVEEALSPHVYVKAEYNYSRYNRLDADLGVQDVSYKMNRQEALAGVGLRF